MRKPLLALALVLGLMTPALASTTFTPPPAPPSVAQGKYVFESIKQGRKDGKHLTEVERRSLELYLKSLKK